MVASILPLAVALLGLSSFCHGSASADDKIKSKTKTKSTVTKTHHTSETKSHTHRTTSAATFVTSTFSIPTASTAASTASELTVDDGAEYIVYSTVDGYFLQDLNSTVASTFDYMTTDFGLINQTYSTDSTADASLTQWQRFNRVLFDLNQLAPSNVVYKLLFIGRHGEGYHNAAQTYYGTPDWNCYYAELDGNGTVTWADAHLTPVGIEQAIAGNIFWQHEIDTQGIQVPQSYYVSPLSRCLETANYTYSNLTLPEYYPFAPTVKEFFREMISIHTCDRRSNRTYIHDSFPSYNIDPDLAEYDELWNGITAETDSSEDYRSKLVLDEVFTTDSSSIISITTHSGETASLLRVLGHRVFGLVTGAIIPVLVKAETLSVPTATTTTSAWTANAWCTNGPPISSQTTGADACVCSNSVQPVATTITQTLAA